MSICCAHVGHAVYTNLVCTDEGLHCQVVLHEFLHIRLSPNQGLGLCETGQARAQWRWTHVGRTWGSSRVGVPEKDVPRLGKVEKKDKYVK